MNRISRRAILGGLGSAIVAPAITSANTTNFGPVFAWQPTTVAQRCSYENLKYCYSIAKPPKYEVPGMTKPYTVENWKGSAPISDRASRMIGIIGDELGGLISFARERYVDIAVQAKLGDLLPIIGERIEPGRSGYLLRINSIKDPVTNDRIPTANLVEPVGPGRSPVEALAERYLADTLAVRQPLSTIRNYFWCTRDENDYFRLDCVDVAFSEELERQAEVESSRRRVLGSTEMLDVSQALERANQAELWRKLSEMHLRYVENKANQILIENLNLQFQASQQRFNEAYSEYQIAQRMLAENEREMAVLSRVSTILSVMKTVWPESKPTPPSDAPDTTQTALSFRKHQLKVLTDASQRASSNLKFTMPTMSRLESELRKAWGTKAGSVPQWVPPPRIPMM